MYIYTHIFEYLVYTQLHIYFHVYLRNIFSIISILQYYNVQSAIHLILFLLHSIPFNACAAETLVLDSTELKN